MKHKDVKEVVAAGMIAALSVFGAGVAAGEHDSHTAEALKHAEAAVAEGKQGSAKALAEHAQQALTHAERAAKAKPDPQITEAQKALKATIEHGNKGHAEVATKSAENAVSYLKMAYKEMLAYKEMQ